MKTNLTVLLLFSILAVSAGRAAPIETSFTYQGRLTRAAGPAHGDYDLKFILYNAPVGGSQVGPLLTNRVTLSQDGLFSVRLDFGPIFQASAYWLEICVRTNGSSTFFPIPRQPITATPQALYAVKAGEAVTASTAGTTQVATTVAPDGVNNAALQNEAVTSAKIGPGQVVKSLNGLTDAVTFSAGRGLFVDGTNFRIADSVAFLDGHQLFIGSNSFRGVTLLTNAANQVAGHFFGNGRGLTNLMTTNLVGTLSETQLPAGIARLGANQTFSGSVNFQPPAGPPFAVTSSETVHNLNADLLDGLDSDAFWQLGGNSGTIPEMNFLGTTDTQPLELRVNNRRAFRLEATPDSPNVIGGWEGNAVRVRPPPFDFLIVSGATIAGGGASNGFFRYPDRFSSTGYTELTVADGTNVVSGNYGTVSGGIGNTIQDYAELSTIGGGAGNRIGRDPFELAPQGSTIGGGIGNRIFSARAPGGVGITIGGGRGNSIHASGFSTITGGDRNFIDEDSDGSTIAGGINNRIGSAAAFSATVGGGEENNVFSSLGTVCGGYTNTIGFLAGGGTIGGGYRNRVEASAGTIPGGVGNTIAFQADYSFAAGRRAVADHAGAFIWADNHDFDFVTTQVNQFAARCVGGARFVSGIDANGGTTAGVVLAPGGGSWSSVSDRNAKENFTPADSREILDRVTKLSITSWNYKTQDESIRHLGPMAQDFKAVFGLGEDDRHINSVDADGVALAAIQGLHAVVKEKDAELQALKATVDELKELVAKLSRAQR